MPHESLDDEGRAEARRPVVRTIRANSLAASKRAFVGRKLHLFFAFGLWFKAIFALPEFVAGVTTFIVPQHALLAFVLWVTNNELADDRHDLLASFLVDTLQHLSVGTQRFAAIYLLGHGTIKLWLIAGLLRQRLWYFPVAISVFGLFVAYQVYRYTFTHAIWLLLITGLDLIVIALTWNEYRGLRGRKKTQAVTS